MKKIVGLSVIVTMSFMLSACGGGGSADSNTPTAESLLVGKTYYVKSYNNRYTQFDFKDETITDYSYVNESMEASDTYPVEYYGQRFRTTEPAGSTTCTLKKENPLTFGCVAGNDSGDVVFLKERPSYGSTDSMEDKNYIVILTHLVRGICEESSFRGNLVNAGYRGVLTREVSLGVTCAAYGKENDEYECTELNIEDDEDIYGDKSCVIGFDSYVDTDTNYKITSDYNLSDLVESITDVLKSMR